MKRFLKAKKGKELVEIIILFPFVVFLIFFTLLQIASAVYSSDVQATANNYMRAFIVKDNLYNALVSTAKELNNYKETTITSIKITTNSDNPTRYTLEFSEDLSENTHFKNLTIKKDGVIQGFNTQPSQAFKESYEAMATVYQRGNYVEIEAVRSILPLINSFSKISIYNQESGRRETLDYGVSGMVKVKVKNIIIS